MRNSRAQVRREENFLLGVLDKRSTQEPLAPVPVGPACGKSPYIPFFKHHRLEEVAHVLYDFGEINKTQSTDFSPHSPSLDFLLLE